MHAVSSSALSAFLSGSMIETDPVPLVSERLFLREFTGTDAAFLLELFSESAFLRYVGDKNVHTVDDAAAYIAQHYQPSYPHGFGMYLITDRTTGARLGVCGLIRRMWLDDFDLGYALLASQRGYGYALEAAGIIVDYARAVLRLPRIVAIIDPGNHDSIHLITKLGFALKGPMRESPQHSEVLLYQLELR